MRLGVNLWKIIWEIYKKIDKMSISDWGTVQKVWRKLEKVLVLRNTCLNFEKKVKGIFEKSSGNFENLWEYLWETLVIYE